MKIGMLTGLWFVAEQATLIESLRRAASLGFHYVDLHGVFHGGPAHLTPRERRDVKIEIDRLGLSARNYVLHAPHNIPAANDAEVEASFEYLKQGIDLALEWDVHQIMLNAGQWVYGMRRMVAWEKSVRFIQRVCDYAAPRHVFIAQETEPFVWFLVDNIPSTLRMIEDIDRDNFAVLVDLGHMGLCRENPADLARLGEVIIHAHISDHEMYRHTNQVIGTGATPLADYLEQFRKMDIDQAMRRFGYDELVISFELGAPGDQIANPDDWVRRSLHHIQQIAPDLSIV